MSEKSLAHTLIEKAIFNKAIVLDLGNCGLTDESPELLLLKECKSLKILNLGTLYRGQNNILVHTNNIGERNQLTTIPPDLPLNILGLFLSVNQIKKIENLEQLKNLTTLYFYSNQISKIENLEQLKNLTTLYLYSNQISKIENLEQLKNLTTLDLSNNQIKNLENLEQLKNLTKLSLNWNKISKIENLEQLKNLTTLDLYSNQISKIENLEQLKNLTTLDLYSNQISKIENLEQLKNLTKLELRGNKIQKIENLEQLIYLTTINLSENQIKDVQPLASIINQLKKLDLSDNPIENINFQTLDNIKLWQEYFKEKESDKVPKTYIKVNIIGDGRIGKTQFINYLTGKKPELNIRETKGIKTCIKEFGDFKLNLWDFGGQNYYHGSHRIMIRKQDMNLVMWSGFRKKSDTEEPFRGYNYWLGTAKDYATEADKKDIFLIQSVWNHIDTEKTIALEQDAKIDRIRLVCEEDMNYYGIEAEHIFSIDVFEAYNKNKKWARKWKEFKEVLNEYLQEKLAKETVEKTWSEYNEQLVNTDVKEFIYSKKEFFQKHKPPIKLEDSKREYWLAQLEYSGVALYLKEIEGLEKNIILHPHKLSEYIHEKLDSIRLEGFGKYTFDQLKEIFSENTEDIVKIMEHYQLFFKDKSTNEEFYVFPQYLSEENSAFKKAIFDLVPYTFSLHYPDYFHEGKFFQFMSQYGEYAEDASSYWKYGILFAHPKYKLKTVVFFNRESSSISFHIEDKKGRTEVASELFNYFAYINSHELLEDIVEEYTEFGEVKIKEKNFLTIADKEKQNKKKLDLKLYRKLKLSTINDIQLDVEDTMQSIKKNNLYGWVEKTKEYVKLDYMTLNLLDNQDKKKHRVFFSYSHKDELYRDELEVHLANLKRSGHIDTWHDRKILPGKNWDNEIKNQLENADIVLLLISPDFIHSDYIWNEELKLINTRKNDENDKIQVVPILLRPCDTQNMDFMIGQGIPRDQKWVLSSHWFSRDEAYLNVVKELRTILS